VPKFGSIRSTQKPFASGAIHHYTGTEIHQVSLTGIINCLVSAQTHFSGAGEADTEIPLCTLKVNYTIYGGDVILSGVYCRNKKA
jgi:hypothetical protein